MSTTKYTGDKRTTEYVVEERSQRHIDWLPLDRFTNRVQAYDWLDILSRHTASQFRVVEVPGDEIAFTGWR